MVVIFFQINSNIDEKYFEKLVSRVLPFDNAQFELRITGTVETDQRVMSFFDVLWGFEVTGGSDQFEPLTVIDVSHTNYASKPTLPSDHLNLGATKRLRLQSWNSEQ